MELQHEDNNSLQQRVSKILRSEHSQYAQEVTHEDAVRDMYDMLQRAEEELASARNLVASIEERVYRLKWQLARMQSESV